MSIAPVAHGSWATASGGSISALFGQPTTPGNFLVLWVADITGASNVTVGAGWTPVKDSTTGADDISVYVRPNCGASETPPTITQSIWGDGWAMLAEFSSVDSSPTAEQSGSSNTGNTTQTATAGGPDASLGNLIIYGAYWNGGAGGTVANTLTDSNGGNPTASAYNTNNGSGQYINAAWGVTTQTGSGADSGTGTLSGAYAGGTCVIASFKASGGGGGTNQPVISIAIDHP